MVQSNSTSILLYAYARNVTSLALHRSTTPSTSRSSPRNARQCCIIPARGSEKRRAALWRLAGLLCAKFLGSPKTRCCLLPAWVLLGPHDEHELQPHARELVFGACGCMSEARSGLDVRRGAPPSPPVGHTQRKIAVVGQA